MSESISQLEPREIWRNFEALNAVPRPSKREDRIIDFMLNFGQSLGLETQRDEIGNVLIRKPASPGFENRPIVVLQAHLDMVHQKNDSTDFDFENQGITMYVDGDWVCANGTTLGADNGLGVAAIMGILETQDLAHPALEALFTIDEETGMTGAKNLAPDWLMGSILLNLDTEDDDEIGVGCAGGVDVTGVGTYKSETPGSNFEGFRIAVSGLRGGHSGMDIHLGLANANKLLVRLLQRCMEVSCFGIGHFSGGNLRNAIPREAVATVALNPEEKFAFESRFQVEKNAIVKEFAAVDSGIDIKIQSCSCPDTIMAISDQVNLLRCLQAVPNGVAYMSYAFPGQTETSNNLATVSVDSGTIKIGCLTRSSSETRKEDLKNTIQSVFSLAGFTTETGGSYPGWQPNPNSRILSVTQKRYKVLFGSDPKILAGHGGLECGIIGAHYPHMDMISIGPTITGAHSPDERASVSSTQKFWHQLKDLLSQIDPE